MNYIQIAKNILHRGDLESKLKIEEFALTLDDPINLPVRAESLKFSQKQVKFPKKGQLKNIKKRALALHFFANHELLAIELFAWSILTFNPPESRLKSILATIEDEQKHLSLYLVKMKEYGVELGDYPLNGFLWKVISKSQSFEEFYALMALTFEQANLDFMKYYIGIFSEIGDESVCKILDIIYQDEIKHVARGVSYLNSVKREADLWSYYQSLLPEKMTPARAKGMTFDESARLSAGLDQKYIQSLKNYSDQFDVTNRKQWKKDTL